MNMGSNQRGGRGGATPRGSTHRTSFIEYVSEVYNSRTAAASAAAVAGTGGGHHHLEALSARGHGSISSGSVASGCSTSLARDLSVRSENVHCNRVLSFNAGHGHAKLQRDLTKSARLAPGTRRHLGIIIKNIRKGQQSNRPFFTHLRPNLMYTYLAVLICC